MSANSARIHEIKARIKQLQQECTDGRNGEDAACSPDYQAVQQEIGLLAAEMRELSHGTESIPGAVAHAVMSGVVWIGSVVGIRFKGQRTVEKIKIVPHIPSAEEKTAGCVYYKAPLALACLGLGKGASARFRVEHGGNALTHHIKITSVKDFAG